MKQGYTSEFLLYRLRGARLSLAQMFIEKFDHPVPGVFGVGAAVDLGARVVEEGMVGAFVYSHFAFLAVLLERGVQAVHFFNRDPLILLRPDEKDRTAQLADRRRVARHVSVERGRGFDLRVAGQ